MALTGRPIMCPGMDTEHRTRPETNNSSGCDQGGKKGAASPSANNENGGRRVRVFPLAVGIFSTTAGSIEVPRHAHALFEVPAKLCTQDCIPLLPGERHAENRRGHGDRVLEPHRSPCFEHAYRHQLRSWRGQVSAHRANKMERATWGGYGSDRSK